MEVFGQSSVKLRSIEAIDESFKEYGQVIEASSDGDEFGSQDAQLDLTKGISRRMHIQHRARFRFRWMRPVTRLQRVFCTSSFGHRMMSTSTLVRCTALFFATILLSCFIIYRAADSLQLTPGSSSSTSFFPNFIPSILDGIGSQVSKDKKLQYVLSNAAMEDRTVILTTMNEAWVAPSSVIDLFLESFRIGDGTSMLLNHLVIIALDQKAFTRCQILHKHCYALVTEGVDFHREAYFMTPSYLKMMWRRIDFLHSVLEMGYNFVFTDADVMWFRDPFPRFYSNADFQIACDHYIGSSYDINNRPNGGFNYVRSNNRSIEFYKFWHESRENYPGYHDQDVFNYIKTDPFISSINLTMRFLDTAYFGGFCEPSRNLSLVCTMHANCCFGIDSKLLDLRMMLQDWRDYMSLPSFLKGKSDLSWSVPHNCSLDSLRHFDPVEESMEGNDEVGSKE